MKDALVTMLAVLIERAQAAGEIERVLDKQGFFLEGELTYHGYSLNDLLPITILYDTLEKIIEKYHCFNDDPVEEDAFWLDIYSNLFVEPLDPEEFSNYIVQELFEQREE